MVKICAVADVHVNDKIKTEPADILTVSGDLTMRGSIDELQRFRKWLVTQPQTHKIVIAGNHDFCLQDHRRAEAETILGGDGIVYLRDQATTVMGLKFYGSPWQPWFHNWAFNLQRGPEIAKYWDLIPPDLDVLLVHGPPFGYGDRTFYGGDHVGCDDLLKAIDAKRPKVTCYGHIHEDPGEWTRNGCKLINCSVGYEVGRRLAGEPVVFELEPRS